MAQITFQEAPLQMREGVVGIGEFHDNHWGRMLALKLLQCAGARALLIEVAESQQNLADGVSGASQTLDPAAARMLDSQGWQTEGVLRLSVLVYQAQKRGISVICADDNIVFNAYRSTTPTGMRRRNNKTMEKILSLASTPAEVKGVIVLGGLEHFVSEHRGSISDMVAAQAGLNFGWVDASTKAGSGFGMEMGAGRADRRGRGGAAGGAAATTTTTTTTRL